MAQKPEEPVEQPQVDEEGEESDDYDDIEEEEDEEAGGYEQEEEGEGDEEEGASPEKGSSLTALLLGGDEAKEVANEELEDEEDDEYNPATEKQPEPEPEIKGPATEAVHIAAPPPIARKRSRDEVEEEASGNGDLAGNYGEAEENSESVLKKARAAEGE